MAVLPDDDRRQVWADFMSEVSAARGVFGALTKADLRATVDAIDQLFNDNQASFNAAIPQPARSVLTTAQKAHLFAAVMRKRYEKGV